MSFLNELKLKKQQLKESDTVVTQADGQRYIEKLIEETFEKICSKPQEYGFVVDTSPDAVPILVIQHLYIGAQDCSTDVVLDKYSIKNVLSLGVKMNLNANNCFVECLDMPQTDIIPVLNKALSFIRKCMLLNENVLVHCNAGVSRSAMVVIAYLMIFEEYTYDRAYGLVKRKRPAIRPNSGFVDQLKLLDRSDLSLDVD